MGGCLYVGFLGFYDGLSGFPLNEAPIYIEKKHDEASQGLYDENDTLNRPIICSVWSLG